MFRSLLALISTIIISTIPAVAQQEDARPPAPALADQQALQDLLPERVGEYSFDQVSVPPFAAGEDDQESIALNVVYQNDAGTSLFLVASQYRDPQRVAELKSGLERDVASGQAADTTLGGQRVFVVGDAARLATFVGATIELTTYFSGGEGSPDDLYAALEAVDFDGMTAVDGEYTQAVDRAAVEDFDREYAASESASEADATVTMSELQALLPDEAGDFRLARFSASMMDDGWGSSTGRALTGRYEAADGQTVSLELIHLLPSESMTVQMPATDTTVAGYSAAEEHDPRVVKVMVGESFAVVARPADGDVPAEALYDVLESVEMGEIEAIDQEYAQAMRDAMAPDGEPTDAITGIEGEIDCASFNEEIKTAMLDQMGGGQLAPWTYVLAEEQASTAERQDGESVNMLRSETILSFPKEGNAWLECVRENDILWAPQGPTMFLVRVTELWDLSDRAAFRVLPAGFTDAVHRGRVEEEVGSPD